MTTIDLKQVKTRAKLKPRRDPYFQQIRLGVHLGWRKMAADSTATWSVRVQTESSHGVFRREFKQFGTLDHLPESARHDEALRQALEFATHLQKGGIAAPMTIRDACDKYITYLSGRKPASSVSATQKRINNLILQDAKFASLELSKINQRIIAGWRAALVNRPVYRGSGRGNKPSVATDKPRANSTINRDTSTLRAVLNHAHDEGWLISDIAWRKELKPIANADGKRELALSREERRRLVQAADAGIAPFIKALCLLPLRPGAVAALRVSDYDARLKTLRISVDKAGANRIIMLPDTTAKFFTQHCKNKTSAAFIFSKPDGSMWNKDLWKWPFKAAVKEAALPEQATAYTLRHSVLTDLVTANKVDLNTIATIAGTSVLMIQKHYAHPAANAATNALGALAI